MEFNSGFKGLKREEVLCVDAGAHLRGGGSGLQPRPPKNEIKKIVDTII